MRAGISDRIIYSVDEERCAGERSRKGLPPGMRSGFVAMSIAGDRPS